MADEPKRPHLDFNALVLSLGSSALIHLGEAPDPVSGKTQEPDLVLAQESIDLLAILQEKTRGNLSEEEARFLDTLLYDLRVRFVAAAGKPRSPGAASEAAKQQN
jgi:Domain of unknown function (DUF1844)